MMRRGWITGIVFAMGLSAANAEGIRPGIDTLSAVEKLTRSSNQQLASLDPDRMRRIASPATRAPAGLASLKRADIDALPKADGGEQWSCLAEALYFEARGETVVGQIAVAEVIVNRVKSGRFPNTVCDVVQQGTGELHRCQFSYRCDGLSDTPVNARAWERVSKVARLVLDGIDDPLTDGALFYHTTAVNPSWARKFRRTAQHGVHLFYRPS